MSRLNKKIKRDFYIASTDECSDVKLDGNVLFKEDFLNCLKNIEFEPSPEDLPPEKGEWYPLVNSYYPYGDAVDPLERTNHLLNTKPSNASFSKFKDEFIHDHLPYREKDAQRVYLASNPLCFIILGRPGINEHRLGKNLAEYWQCEYIEPHTLISQEIESGSRAGQCIEFNLRKGKSIGIDVILRLVEKRVNSETAKHRGFVFCGLPLIPNNLYEEELITKESTMFNVKEIFKDIVETTLETGVPFLTPEEMEAEAAAIQAEREAELKFEEGEEEAEEDPEHKEPPTAAAPPSPAPDQAGLEGTPTLTEQKQQPPVHAIPQDLGEETDVCYSPEISTDYESQLDFLFSFLKPPFFIIYMLCPPGECILRRKNTRFNIYAQAKVDMLGENTNLMLYEYYSHHPEVLKEVPHDAYDTYFFEIKIGCKGSRHLVLLPKDFPAAIEAQLDFYHQIAQNFIERRIMVHDREYFVKVDARTSLRRMMYIIKAKLHTLPISKVLIPERIIREPTLVTVEQAVQEGEPETSELDMEAHFDGLRRIGIPFETFKWAWSDWGSKCPVSLRHGTLTEGDPNIAVRFMNKIFFLSDEDAWLKFYRNPRPYLVDLTPKPAVKIFIFGPFTCGKSCVSECLGYLLDAEVLSTGTIQLDFIIEKEKEFYANIRERATAESINMLDEQRIKEAETQEAKRILSIKTWANKVRESIDKLELLYLEREKELQGDVKFELSSFPMAMAKVEVSELETDTTIAIRKVRDELELLNIPNFDTPAEYKALKVSKNKFLSYVPVSFKKKFVAIPATAKDQFVIDYVNKALAGAVFVGADLIEQNMVEMLVNGLKNAEKIAQAKGREKGGWIVDGMQCELHVLEEILSSFRPDEIILLKDKEDFEFLRERYKTRGGNQFFHYKSFFTEIGRPDAANRCPSLSSTSFENKMVRNILSEVFDAPGLDGVASTGALLRDENYYAELLKFNIKWREIEEFFNSKGLEIMEIEVTDKSLPELMKEVIRLVEDRYRVSATPLNEKDRAVEIQGYIAANLVLSEGFPGEESSPPTGTHLTPVATGTEEGVTSEANIFRRYGDTYHYCPVTYSEKWVLWKGKEEFAVKFKDRVYLLSSEEDFEKFLQEPRVYLPGNFPTKIPPPRICITGSVGTGKSVFARTLAENYGLHYVSYETFLKNVYHIEGEETFEELKNQPHLSEEVRAYLVGNTELSESFYANSLSSLWFEEPTKTVGFVLDDFPKRPCDAEQMVKLKLIPDIIIELKGDEETIITSLTEKRLSYWKGNKDMFYVQKKKQYQEKLREWEENRQKRFNELLEEKRESRYDEKKKKKEEEQANEPAPLPGKTDSQVSFDSLADQQDVDEINRLLEIDLPTVVLEPMETEEEMSEKITNKLRDHQVKESDYLETLRGSYTELYLPYIEMVVDPDDYDLNVRRIYCLTDEFKYRNLSFLETCFDVPYELAEKLISYGCCFINKKFGKMCPVEYHENKKTFITIPNFENHFSIFPIVHRSYIYYVNGESNAKKFKENPLLYIKKDVVDYPIVPVKISITGPPKCGKTTLANRIAQEYGMKVISRGQAIRFVMRFLPLSNLASVIEKVLRKGWEITDEMVLRCVKAAAIDPRCVTRGVVFDGFPNAIIETKQMSYFGLIPDLVINLEATQTETLECYNYDEGRRGFRKYSVNFIKHLREEWDENVDDFEHWFNKEYQISCPVSIDPSLWSVWYRTAEIIKTVATELRHYFVNCHKDWPLRLAYMQVTPLEFLERKSAYGTFCPCCLLLKEILNTGGSPPDRMGLVQWRKYFYWICNEHLHLFLRTPDAYISPYGRTPPEHLPTVLDLRYSKPKNLFDDGFCASCYKNNTLMIRGITKHAAFYKDQTYLFCSLDCLEEFLQRPSLYCFKINFRPPTDYVGLASRVPVPDERFDYLCEYFKPASKVPAFLNVVDIAGLVKGASEGQGLGNAFLSHISACDAIFHLCRAFEDDDVTHVEGDVNPVRDLDIICEELRLKDEDSLMKALDKLEKTVGRGSDKKLKPEYDTLHKIKQVLVDEKKHIRFADWDTKDIEILNKYLFLTCKPAIYLVNLAEKDYIKKKNKWLVKIKEWVDKNDPGSVIIPFSGAFEHKLLEEFDDPVLRKKYLEDNATASVLDKIIVQGYKTLQLEYFFTSGPDEVKAWTIQKGTKAPQAAGRIHTDFEKGFIMAEVMKFQDFKEEGSEAACKGAGKYRQQGRNYVVEDGDIIFFKFNAGAGLQAAKKK